MQLKGFARQSKYAKEVLRLEARAISQVARKINEGFSRAVDLICACKGRVVVTGMGKPGIIAQKISATLSSTGSPSLYLHPAEAIHGDLGRVTKDDVVLTLSNSGETEEVNRLLDPVKKIGAKVISITGDPESTLARYSDVVLDIGRIPEACPLGLAPTASTTAMLALGDALALTVLRRRGFSKEDYAFYHPGGSLGKRLLKVEDLMRLGEASPTVRASTRVKDALLAITRGRAGAVTVVNGKGELLGIFTDGDLRRHLASTPRLMDLPISKVMTPRPKAVSKDALASDAFRILKAHKIDELPVIDKRNKVIGLLDVQDLLAVGLM